MNTRANKTWRILFTLAFMQLFFILSVNAQGTSKGAGHAGLFIFLILFLVVVLGIAISTLAKTKEMISENRKTKASFKDKDFGNYLRDLDSREIEIILKRKRNPSKDNDAGGSDGLKFKSAFLSIVSLLTTTGLFAQNNKGQPDSLLSEEGVIITIILVMTPIAIGVLLMFLKVRGLFRQFRNKRNLAEADKLADYISSLDNEEAVTALEKRKAALDYQLSHTELAGAFSAADEKGMISNAGPASGLTFVAIKKKAVKRPNIDPQLAKLILWYIGTAAFWLLFGTTIGEYLGIKFVSPDADHLSWLSFGRLRPVHTNAVFWGWASLGMLGLGHYIVPTVSNTALASLKKGWYALCLINASVVMGTICLMAGINNGGGEYREYIWPVMLLFAIGVVLTLINFLQTIAKRKTKEIYISNWYMVAAVMFAIVIMLTAYIPVWQNGLGETIVQGYYMHQGVGMWFMLFTLGIVYYFLPQQLNKPIYSYSLGILAFWTQILFYTVIGTHHFVFSAIPWWLQTVAIVGSIGMIIPVVAGTTNFLLTFKGAWHKVAGSYTLPFFLIGIVFYFTGSMQGTAEAFRSTNLIWHFTDFTVAHSHLTMYGIISFFLWAAIYAVVPRLTGKEPPQVTVGAHFWLALIGLLFYTIPLMYGSTMRGWMWVKGMPFIDTVTHMAPYWLWRAIGGSLMWLSHIFFAYNVYRMLASRGITDVKEAALKKLEQGLIKN
ncbi:cbb3-type cytochrome c oxidase subunit I [Chitinophaga sp. GbtcB8]|uniref:cbb3-type cytochrome c oxidase subunit I n=1 Tax=Chitinophaga sp. GbtcB8 TaxID=2824753 RepID=UPI0020C68B57|nr:cbb3-type cytochrome c oxidase subunit I [Chitinophaga sp. GbtcB8]